MSANKISQDLIDRVTIRKDNDWLCLYDLYKKILIRCSRFGKEHVVNDTARDRAQQRDAEGFIRIRPKVEYEIK